MSVERPIDVRDEAMARRNGRTVATALGFVVVAVSLTGCLVWLELQSGIPPTSPIPFAVAAVLLLIGERTEAAWIRFGPVDVVTPLWLFGFAMLQLGSGTLALSVTVTGTLLHSTKQRGNPGDTVVRVASTTIAIAAAGLIMHAFGTPTAPNRLDSASWDWAGAVALAGSLVVVMNTVSAAVWLAARRNTSFVPLLRQGVTTRAGAEGALLSLAPIWVIGLRLSPVSLPLLAITTGLVFRSTRQALQQAHEARHDQLTGLLNRGAFLAQVDGHLLPRRPAGTIVMLMDLNGFKDVNDRLGHPMGDALLISFAQRLEGAIPSHAHAARLGGDEFAVVVGGTSIDPAELASGLHRHLSQPLLMEGLPVSVGVAIGVAVSPRNGATASDLIRSADVAMYRAKRTGAPYAMYDGTARVARPHPNLLADLGGAISAEQLFVQYQPLLRLQDGSIDSIEALVRWQHPRHGPIPPSEFIGLAEQTDLIEPITDVVVRAAINGLGRREPPVRLAVNVSSRSLENVTFGDRLLDLLEETGLPPHRLEIEVGAPSVAQSTDRAAYTIGRLRAAGIRVALDDFGVSHASYHTLRELEVDRIKIDRDFVQNMLTSSRDLIIIASVIDLAHGLGLDVSAEGVESPQVWNTLRELGCDVAQGYGIAVPMIEAEMRTWLAHWQSLAVTEPSLSRPVTFDKLEG